MGEMGDSAEKALEEGCLAEHLWCGPSHLLGVPCCVHVHLTLLKDDTRLCFLDALALVYLGIITK